MVFLQQQRWKIEFELSQKELVGQNELPVQEDTKELNTVANVSDKANGYVENDEVWKLRSSGFSQPKSKMCRARDGSKDNNKVMLRMDGKCRKEETLKRDGKGANVPLEGEA